MNMRLNSAILATLAVGFCVQVAQAETLTDFFQQSTIDGQIRSYYFNRLYGAPNIPNQDAFSLGGVWFFGVHRGASALIIIQDAAGRLTDLFFF